MKTLTSQQEKANQQEKDKSRSTHMAILKGLVWVALFVFLGKVVGAAKEMAIAYRYGVSEYVDAYLFLFNLISWPVVVWFSVISFMLPPLAADLIKNSPKELSHFRSEILAFALLLGINLSLCFWFGLPLLLKTAWIGLSPSTVLIAQSIVPEIVSLLPLGILVGLLSAWTLASGRHSNSLLESVPALAILIAVLLLPFHGVKPLIWGTVVGFILHVLALALPLAWRGEMEWPRFTSRSPHWPYFWKGFGILLVGSALGSFNSVADQFFAAKLDAGSIATLSYANRILALLLGLGATAISRATLPIFSKLKTQEQGDLKRIAMFWVRLMLFLGFVTAAVSWWLAPWIVKLLFERGAFSASNTLVVSNIFRYGLTQVPFYFSSVVLLTLFATYGKHKLMAISGSCNLFVKVAANYWLLPIMGINAIIVSSGIMYLSSLIMLYLFAQFGLKNK